MANRVYKALRLDHVQQEVLSRQALVAHFLNDPDDGTCDTQMAVDILQKEAVGSGRTENQPRLARVLGATRYDNLGIDGG